MSSEPSAANVNAASSGSAPPRPAPGSPRPYAFPRFERRVLPNGLTLVVAPVHRLPMATVLAVVDAGAVTDPDGKEGLASLTARALAEGAGSLGGVELTDTFERLGAALEPDAGWDTATAGTTVLAARLPEAVRLLATVLIEPAFPEREIARLREERIAEILQQLAEPRGLADEMFDRFVYADGSRFSRPQGGSTETVGRLTRDDVVAFHGARYRPGATTIIVTGDVTADAAERLVRDAFGAWSGAAPGTVAVDPAPRGVERRVHVVGKADAPQSELRIGHVGLPRAHPDYFDVVVMNALLGGLFSSRINLNLREAHGYTYGAFSAYEWRRAAGPFAVSTAVRSDVTAAAAHECLVEIDRMRAAPVSDEERSLATSYLDGVFPIRYETTSAIAAALGTLVTYGLPDDYFDRYRERIRAVTVDGILRAARTHLHPDRMQMVVVGDPAAIVAGLEALEFGPVEVH